MPIVWPTNLAGASLVTLRQAHRRQAQLAEGVEQVGQEQPGRADLAAGYDVLRCQHHHVEADAQRIRPRPIFTGADGSRLRAPSYTQIHAKNGANRMMNSGLMDWYQRAGCRHGTSSQRRDGRCSRAANRLNVVACCSKPAQNMRRRGRTRTMTTDAFRSSAIQARRKTPGSRRRTPRARRSRQVAPLRDRRRDCLHRASNAEAHGAAPASAPPMAMGVQLARALGRRPRPARSPRRRDACA